ncbi:MAG: L,D-transpeptidase [Bacillota bacterium]
MARSIDINLTARRLTLYEDGQPVREYPVGIGKPSTPTPTGQFTIAEKAIVSDPDFGTRWMALSGGQGYGIHGTYNEASVGRAMSHGCVRMRIPDAEELYDLVEVGTPVNIHR